MANKAVNDVKLQIRVENGTNASGGQSIKNINLNNIKLDAVDDALLACGQAGSNLQTLPLSGIRLVNTYDLTDE